MGIVIAVKDNTITVQEGNLDGTTNTFQDAKKDWQWFLFPVWRATKPIMKDFACNAQRSLA